MLKTYVINCKQNNDRMDMFRKYCKKANLSFERVECVNGRKFDKKKLCTMMQKGS